MIIFVFSLRDGQLSVFSKSVTEKKPFRVVYSDFRRYTVRSAYIMCPFSLSFNKRVDEFFHLVENKQHTCIDAVSTIKKTWVNEKVKDILRDGKKHSPSEIIDILYNVHGVRVGAVVMSHALTDIKNVMWQEGTSFGHVRSYLDALRTNNDGTDTSLVVEEGVFKRAFVALGMCVRAFAVSTRVVGLDACHDKAKYGGVLLVMTVLDGDGSVFPAALAIA